MEEAKVGFYGALFIVFLVLKLCGVISWSWWLVTAPLWGPAVAFLAFVGVAGVVVFLFGNSGRKPSKGIW